MLYVFEHAGHDQINGILSGHVFQQQVKGIAVEIIEDDIGHGTASQRVQDGMVEVLLEGIEFVENKKETMRDFHAGRTDEIAYALFRFNESAADQLVHGQQHGTTGEP